MEEGGERSVCGVWCGVVWCGVGWVGLGWVGSGGVVCVGGGGGADLCV